MTADLFSTDVTHGVKPGPTAEEIYSAFPKKAGRLYALRAIEKAIKRGENANRLMERVQAYAAAVKLWPANDREYIPYAATWMNRGSYDDDPATWVRKVGKGRASFA